MGAGGYGADSFFLGPEKEKEKEKDKEKEKGKPRKRKRKRKRQRKSRGGMAICGTKPVVFIALFCKQGNKKHQLYQQISSSLSLSLSLSLWGGETPMPPKGKGKCEMEFFDSIKNTSPFR